MINSFIRLREHPTVAKWIVRKPIFEGLAAKIWSTHLARWLRLSFHRASREETDLWMDSWLESG